MYRYRLYGVTVETDYPFLAPVPATDGPASLGIRLAPALSGESARALIYEHPHELWDDASPTAIWQSGAHALLSFPDGDQVWLSARQIRYSPYSASLPARPDLYDARLLGSVMAWWLHSQGRLPLHAAALRINGAATLFMAESGTGKSSLSASLIQKGVPMLCDDFTAIAPAPDGTLLAQPAYPQMRLWPGTIERFVGPPAAYPTVFMGGTKRRVPLGQGWGHFLHEAHPVTRIYFLNRDESTTGEVRAEPLVGHEAFMQLLAASTMATFVPPQRLNAAWAMVERLVAQAQVFQLHYPSGWRWLPALHDIVLAP